MVHVVGNFIAGKWETPEGCERAKSVNPAAPSEVLCEFVQGDREDVKRAVQAAKDALPAWSKMPAPSRGRIISKVAQLALARKDELGALMCREEGKLLAESIGEIAKGINVLEWYGGEGMRMGGKTAPSEMGNTFLYTTRVPLGVVGLITPWNFPWAIPCWKIAPALVAGNTVVFKPASLTVAIAEELVKLFEEAGLPPGVLNMVVGPGRSVGAEVAENKDIAAVSFTGSNSVGMGVLKAATERMAKVTLEMGGKNPAIIMDDASLDLAVAGVIKGAFGGTGQRCTATSRLILHESIKESFLEKLVVKAKEIIPGPGMEAASGIGPVVDAHQHQSVLGFLERVKKEEGARILLGGGAPEGEHLKEGFFVEPTIVDGVTQDMEIWQEEVFGPVLAVIAARDFDHAMELANDCKFGLSSAFYSNDPTLIMRYVDEMDAGMLHVNSPTIGGEAQVPFGGSKATGYGDREMSEDGLHFFTEPKTVWIDYTGKPRTSNIY
jgi:aldehyde dehydrogenase (NAD+)